MDQPKKEVLESWHKKMLYAVSAVLWLSGIVWLYFRYYAESRDEFGPQAHPVQAMSLKIHGMAAIVFLIIFGTLLYHIRPGWRQKQQRPSGVSLLTTCIILILTGWGLYYVGDEQLRSLTSIIHCILGLSLPGIIFFHVWRIVRRRFKNG